MGADEIETVGVGEACEILETVNSDGDWRPIRLNVKCPEGSTCLYVRLFVLSNLEMRIFK